MNEKEVDELIVLDISSTKNNTPPDWELISLIAKNCRMPLCYGGGVKSVAMVEKLISLGGKSCNRKFMFTSPDIIKDSAKSVGKQSIVGIIDVKKFDSIKKVQVVVFGGMKTNMDHIQYSNYLMQYGVGEILLQNIDLDGTMLGFDQRLIREVYENIDVPLTVLGGAGSLKDIQFLINKYKIIGVAAGSIFVFKGNIAVLVNYPSKEEKSKIINNIYQ